MDNGTKPFSEKAFDLTDEMRHEAAKAAALFNVASTLDERDQLIGWSINQIKRPPPVAANSYIVGGHHDAVKAKERLDSLNKARTGRRVLEFAAGFGRVTRHFKVLAPNDHFVASDIHPEACQFITDSLGVESLQSTTNPSALSIDEKFDFIFVLSFFSHLPKKTFGPWLKALYALLNPGGTLLFTTHGEYALRKPGTAFASYYKKSAGFGYRGFSEQRDLNSDDYGTAVVSMKFVLKELDRALSAYEVVSYRSAIWFGLQDEWLVKKLEMSVSG